MPRVATHVQHVLASLVVALSCCVGEERSDTSPPAAARGENAAGRSTTPNLAPGVYFGQREEPRGAPSAWLLVVDSMQRAAWYRPLEMLALCTVRVDSGGAARLVSEEGITGTVLFAGRVVDGGIVGTVHVEGDYLRTGASPEIVLHRIADALPADPLSGVYAGPVYYGQETGDVSGQEIVLIASDSGLIGTIVYVEGQPGNADVLRAVHRTGDTLRLELAESQPRQWMALVSADTLTLLSEEDDTRVVLTRVPLRVSLSNAWERRDCGAAQPPRSP